MSKWLGPLRRFDSMMSPPKWKDLEFDGGPFKPSKPSIDTTGLDEGELRKFLYTKPSFWFQGFSSTFQIPFLQDLIRTSLL